jgi:glutamine kinase
LTTPDKFGSKADTIKYLSGKLSSCQLPEFRVFQVAEWTENKEKVLQTIAKDLASGQIIIRSSAANEDSQSASMAGHYNTVAGVKPDDPDALQVAIEEVVGSYEYGSDNTTSNHQFLAQKEIFDVEMSGVLLTRELDSGGPYYVLNYDDHTGRTDSITSGGYFSDQTIFVRHNFQNSELSNRVSNLLAVATELQQVLDCDILDIEFAVDRQGIIQLFQVRRIASASHWYPEIEMRVEDELVNIEKVLQQAEKTCVNKFGLRPLYGNMPDWNPAEIIGYAPRSLAFNLYRYLVTDNVWADSRRQMGYADLTGNPLLVSFGGQPFVNVALSFLSLMPAGLSEDIRVKLAQAYCDRLRENPELHDKIEFEIALTAYSFDFDKKLENFYPGLLSEAEKAIFRKGLLDLTRSLISGQRESIADQLSSVNILVQERKFLEEREVDNPLAAARALLEQAVRYGTIPFSKIARHAFIAETMIRSLLEIGILKRGDYDKFKASIRSVATEYNLDCDRVLAASLSWESFLKNYGHLRPGTYDILSLRYDQRQDLLPVPLSGTKSQNPEKKDFELTLKQKELLTSLLEAESFGLDADELFDYFRQAVEGREFVKFEFTRNVSRALEQIARWGQDAGLTREELSHLELGDIFPMIDRQVSSQDILQLKSISEKNANAHLVTRALKLPHLVCSTNDFSVVISHKGTPNFITSKICRSRCVTIEEYQTEYVDIEGAIVLIEKADPGFDWIFSHNIGGLITKFGGSNSHMAIRCSEFELPAAIGCGEQMFGLISRLPELELNCSVGSIRMIEG